MKRTVRFSARVGMAATACALLLAGCGGPEIPTSASTPTPTPSAVTPSATPTKNVASQPNGRTAPSPTTVPGRSESPGAGKNIKAGKPPIDIGGGKRFTCSQVLYEGQKACGEYMEILYGRWGKNITAFITSKRLGPIGNDFGQGKTLRAGDVVWSGLMACGYREVKNPKKEFIDMMIELYPVKERVQYYQMWFEPAASLCPDMDRPEPELKSITYEGKKYSCGKLLIFEDDTCSDAFQASWNKWGDTLPAYLTYVKGGKASSSLSEWDKSYIALFAMATCEIPNTPEQRKAYVINFRKGYKYSKVFDKDVGKFWDLARKRVCPGAPG